MVSAFSTPACSESIPGAFTFFKGFITVSTSAREGGSVLMLRPSEGPQFAASLGCRRLGASLKCSTHLAACSFSVVITFPSSSLIGLMWVLLSPLSCLVILFTVLRSLLAVAFFALPASSSTKALLPLQALFFDVLL